MRRKITMLLLRIFNRKKYDLIYRAEFKRGLKKLTKNQLTRKCIDLQTQISIYSSKARTKQLKKISRQVKKSRRSK